MKWTEEYSASAFLAALHLLLIIHYMFYFAFFTLHIIHNIVFVPSKFLDARNGLVFLIFFFLCIAVVMKRLYFSMVIFQVVHLHATCFLVFIQC